MLSLGNTKRKAVRGTRLEATLKQTLLPWRMLSKSQSQQGY